MTATEAIDFKEFKAQAGMLELAAKLVLQGQQVLPVMLEQQEPQVLQEQPEIAS